jgi:predicted membrane protein DUF2306
MAKAVMAARSRWTVRLLWAVMIVLCLIGAIASVNRIALIFHPSLIAQNLQFAGRVPQLAVHVPEFAAMEAEFQGKRGLLFLHVFPGLLFMLLVSAQFLPAIRSRHIQAHRWIGRILMGAGAIIGVSGVVLVLDAPIGGMDEVIALVFFGVLFLFCMGRALWHVRQKNIPLHREWVIRATGIVLGIATIRLGLTVVATTHALDHVRIHDIFGTACWISFTLSTLAGEAWVRHTRS